jgi:hypothetical protein
MMLEDRFRDGNITFIKSCFDRAEGQVHGQTISSNATVLGDSLSEVCNLANIIRNQMILSRYIEQMEIYEKAEV